MRNQAPLGPTLQWRTYSLRWLLQAANPGKGGCPLQLKISQLPAKRQLSRQVAIGAGCMDSQGFDRRQGGSKVEIDQGEIDFSARIPLFLRWPAGGMPEGPLPLPVGGMLHGVEGLKVEQFLKVRGGADDRVDRIDLGNVLAAHVGNDP